MERNADIDPGLRPLIDTAIADLAARLDVERSEIMVESATLCTWSDRGFADRSGRRQAQVPVDGSEIVLSHRDRIYRYRTGGHNYTPTLY